MVFVWHIYSTQDLGKFLLTVQRKSMLTGQSISRKSWMNCMWPSRENSGTIPQTDRGSWTLTETWRNWYAGPKNRTTLRRVFTPVFPIGTQTGCLGNMISKKQPFPFRKIFEKPPFDSFASLYIISIKEFIDLYT